MFAIELGVTVRDRVTGFEGRVTGRCDYITGCNQYLVQPPIRDDGKWNDARWFDENRIEMTNAEALQLDAATSGTDTQRFGADAAAPIK